MSTQQVVFIDSRVPDIQDLLSGLEPGVQAFVLDPASDGLQQIADIVAANNFNNLSSISIVSHGATGELVLGTSLITDGNLAEHSGALAAIGAALAPAGAVQLYGCDVAQGQAGQQFINDFSALAGGAVVDASTHVIGSTALGGSWTLDASSNGSGAPAPSIFAAAAPTPSPAAASAPFTPAALADFQNPLAAGPTGQLFFRINMGSDDQIGAINNTGAAATHQSIYFGGGILFQNSLGTPMIWTMNGTSVTATATLPNPGIFSHANTG